MATPKTPNIPRLFTEKDERVLVRAMIRYKSEKGHDAVSDLRAFMNFVNPLLSFTATKGQLSDKIRRLNKKFLNNAKRIKNEKNPHEVKLFKLSKKVWGSHDHLDGDDCWSLKYPFLCVAIESEAKKNLSMQMCLKEYVKKVILGMDEEKARELEQEFKGIFLQEHEFSVMKTEVLCEQSEVIKNVVSQNAAN